MALLIPICIRLSFIIIILSSFFLSSDTRKTLKETEHPIFTTKRDITTPITTVPTLTPATSTPTPTPTSTSSDDPIIIPTSNPDSSTTPLAAPTGSGSSWCVASQSASQKALQIGLDYACGYGGVDCSAIQPGGGCYNPDNVRDHASYAFNSYYQKNPVPSSCNFAGAAITTSTNPSTGTCQYPSTSTSSSVLNTSNSNGAKVYGGVPSPPTTSLATPARATALPFLLCISLFFFLSFISQ